MTNNRKRFAAALLCVAASTVGSAQFTFTAFEDAVVLRDPAVSECNVVPTGLSADGKSFSASRRYWWPSGHPKFGPEAEAMVFRYSGGTWTGTLLGDFPKSGKNNSRTWGISGDGVRILGQGDDGRNYHDVLFNPFYQLPKVGGVYSSIEAEAINFDGSVVVGWGTGSYTEDPWGATQLYWHRWVNGAIQTITPIGVSGYPTGVSWDGSIFTGYSSSDATLNRHTAFRYVEGSGLEWLPKPDTIKHIYVNGISGNGQVIVGTGQTYEEAFSDRYPWFYSDVMGTVVVPGPTGQRRGEFKAANADGSVLVGVCRDDPFDVGTPLLWTAHSGPIDLAAYLVANGIDTGIYKLKTAIGVSADGRTILGIASRPHPDTGDTEDLPFIVHIDLPQGITNLTAGKSSLVGGSSMTGSVYLYRNATDLETVTLTSSHPEILSVPTSVSVSSGTKRGNFPITSVPVATEQDVVITAEYGEATKTFTVTVTPAGIKFAKLEYDGQPDPVDGGKPVGLTVVLDGPAGPGGATVKVWDNSTYFSPPNTEGEALDVVIPEGQTVGKLQIQTKSFTRDLTRDVYVKLGTQLVTLPLSLRPWYVVKKVTVNPNYINAGEAANVTVILTLPARPGGETVYLSATNPLVQVPEFIVVPEGQLSASQTLTTALDYSSYKAAVVATLGGNTVEAKMTVKGPKLASVALPSSFQGGSTVTCTITLTAKVPADSTIALKSTVAALQAPASVVIPAGSKSVTFTMPSTAVGSAQSGELIVKFGGGTMKVAFTVNP